jgi:2-methylcitrate dehydratase PrpD
VGVEAALLADRGFTAAPIDAPHGYLSVSDVMPDDMAQATRGLGFQYTVDDCAIKLYPCCGYSHGAIDAAIALHERLPRDCRDIKSVTVRSYNLVVDSIGGRYTEPGSSFTQCQFSLPFLVAVALADGCVGVSQLSAARRADPAVHELARRVLVVEDPGFTAQYPERFPYEVEVAVDGSVLTESVDAPRGTRQRPLTRLEIRAKFDALTEPVLGRAASARLAEAVGRLNTLPAFSIGIFVEGARDRHRRDPGRAATD